MKANIFWLKILAIGLAIIGFGYLIAKFLRLFKDPKSKMLGKIIKARAEIDIKKADVKISEIDQEIKDLVKIKQLTINTQIKTAKDIEELLDDEAIEELQRILRE